MSATWGGWSAEVATDPAPSRAEGRHAWTASVMFDLADPDRDLVLERLGAAMLVR